MALSPLSVQAEEITLKLLTTLPLGNLLNKPIDDFVADVNKSCAGTVKIHQVGGPESIPSFEGGNAVRAGVVDITYAPYAYFAGLMPEAGAIRLSENSIMEQRENGAWEYLNKLYNEKMNVWHLARTMDGSGFHLYLTKPITGPDLSGLTMRGIPTTHAAMNALGANVVQVAPGEVYVALERGLVNGFSWPAVGLFEGGFADLTKYRVEPAFYRNESNVLVNLDRWNSLSDAQKECLNGAAERIEASASTVWQGVVDAEIVKQTEAGIEPIVLSDADAEKFLTTVKEAGWAEFEKLSPEHAKALRPLLEK